MRSRCAAPNPPGPRGRGGGAGGGGGGGVGGVVLRDAHPGRAYPWPVAALIGVDIGGTFTDVAVVHDGALTTAKVSTTPDDQSRGMAEGTALALSRAGLRPGQVSHLAHGTTVATNALLERRGARTG